MFDSSHAVSALARHAMLAKRSGKRGTLLIVVLALLVVLSLIGIAFGFIVIAEQQAASNALVRFKAASAARDGEAYAVAALRTIPLVSHYDSRGYWSFQMPVNDEGRPQLDDEGYLQRLIDAPFLEPTSDLRIQSGAVPPEPIIPSFSRNLSTNTSDTPNLNWVDLNGNGIIDEANGELGIASDYISTDESKDKAREASYWVGEGIDRRMFKTAVTAGTFRELGDRARLKIIDTNSQLNINDYNGAQLSYMLQVLGIEIAKMTNGENPFPEQIADGIVRLKSRVGVLASKTQLLPLYDAANLANLDQRDIEFAFDFIAVHSYPLPGASNGTQPNYNAERNPVLNARLDDVADFNGRDPFSAELGGDDQAAANVAERDGRPEMLPQGIRLTRSPVNINTVTKPVLIAMLAGIEAEARFLYFPARDVVTEADFTNSNIETLVYGVTDAGRQPVSTITDEDKFSLPSTNGLNNRSPYQVIPVGPIGYTLTPQWKEGANQLTDPWYNSAQDNATKLAEKILEERDNEPFRSWMDFDYRIFHQMLSGFREQQPSRRSADLIATGRNDRGRELDGNLDRAPWGGDRLLPDPRELAHPAAGAISSANTSYSTAEFNAWYWRSCVDMLRSAFNPNGYLNKFNPDSAYYTTVDSTDLKYNTAPLCFSSMGVYEVISQGEIVATQIGDVNATTEGGLIRDVPVARRTFRSVVEVYSVKQHTTQRDFLRPIGPDDFRTNVTSASSKQVESVVRHDLEGTQTYPYSIDHAVFDYIDELRDANVAESAVSIHKGIPKRSGAAVNNDEKALGYFNLTTADDVFGWITLRPLDRTPLEDTNGGQGASGVRRLNFHAPYNYSLDGRQRGTTGGLEFGNTNNTFGATPYVGDAGGNAIDNRLLDSLNSATPNARTDIGQFLGNEEASQDNNQDSARYATLRPDGVLLRGWHLNPMFRLGKGDRTSPSQTYRLRNQNRMNRLALLRYRAGFIGNTPFAPINDENPDSAAENIPGSDVAAVKQRISGGTAAANDQGSDQPTDPQNIAKQDSRQKNSNFPYYQGWVDFWIKWELPPQGEEKKAVSAGEIDPGSGNFSGLLGATVYGRFSPTGNQASTPGVTNYNNWSNGSEAAEADFEGHELFVFKEPGGVLRVTSMYFNRAWTPSWGGGGTTGGPSFQVPTGYHRLGNDYRLFGKAERQPTADEPPIDPNDPVNKVSDYDILIATNDVCGSNPLDMGFSYARMDSWVNLNDSSVDADLVTHNWYRFSLKYRSNARYRSGVMQTQEPHELFLDGRKIQMQFDHPRVSPGDTKASNEALVNTGEITDDQGNLLQLSWLNDTDQPTDFWIHRTALALIEVDPEDRLTIGCVFRRQQPNAVRDSAIDSANIAPLFRYDSNVIAPANATIDDVRIFWQLNSQFGGGMGYAQDRAINYSRYQNNNVAGQVRGGPLEQRGVYENGFVATTSTSGGSTRLFPFPVRVASVAWTEYRPWWDSYRRERIDYAEDQWAKAPQVMIWCEVIEDMSRAERGGITVRPDNTAFDSVNRNNSNFWLNGGYAFADIGDVPVYIRNDTTNAGNPTVGMLKYRAFFVNPSSGPVKVMNTTPVLDDVRITLLTPPRRVYSEEVLR